MKFHPILKNRFFLFVGLAVLILFLLLDAKQYKQHKEVSADINALISQENQLQQQNQELQSAVNDWQSNPTENAEKVARQEFNKQKVGEQVFSFKLNTPDGSSGSGSGADNSPYAGDSNAQKWLYYFFQNE
jgi:cell division protein FtsB